MSLQDRTQRVLALFQSGRFHEAEVEARALAAAQPDFAFAWKVLGAAVSIQGGNGIPMLQKAVELMPDDHEGHNNLGNAYQDLGRYEDAARSYRQALALRPDYAHAHGNLGNALRALHRWHEAEQACRRALELAPGFAEGHANLGHVLEDLGEVDEARRCLQRALELDPDVPEARSKLLYMMNCLDSRSGMALREEARRYGDALARKAKPHSRWQNSRDPARPLQVGLVSGDLGNHPVGYFLEGVVAALAQNELRLHVYDSHPRNDRLAEGLRKRIPRWHAITGASDESLAARIRADGIDVLIDLSGHTVHNRLPMFAWHPAPVQVTWLGYFGTTGVLGMDYILVDRWSVPEGEEKQFSEQVWRLPETRLCFTPPQDEVAVGPLPARVAGRITFGYFGSQSKINDGVLDTWAEVLRAVPRSTLLLKAKQLGDAALRGRLLERFARRGVGAERLTLEGLSPRREYLEAYNRIDIALDTFPFPGGTTTMEGLWMGVPVVGLRGERFLSRQGESLLMNAGLGDWIGADRRGYVELAARMSADLDALARLRSSLRSRLERSPLMDAPRFASHFEAALRGMWRRWCAGG
jgi:predicted O-linked N-acetylglucosamine transferase (SPINDLY family)